MANPILSDEAQEFASRTCRIKLYDGTEYAPEEVVSLGGYEMTIKEFGTEIVVKYSDVKSIEFIDTTYWTTGSRVNPQAKKSQGEG